MRKRYMELLEYLERSDADFVSGSELAERFGVTTRTIRSDIKEINETYLDGAVIAGDTRKGYKLVGSPSAIRPPEDEEERAFHIVKALLAEPDFITYEELARRLYFSPQTIRKDVQKLLREIRSERRGVEIEAIVFRGIRLKGGEAEQRILLKKKITTEGLKRMPLDEALRYYFDDWFDRSVIRLVCGCIEEEAAARSLPLNARELFSICANLLIALKRVSLGRFVTEADMKLEHAELEELPVAGELLDRLTRRLREQEEGQGGEYGELAFDAYERQYLAYLLIALQILPKRSGTHDPAVGDEATKRRVAEVVRDVGARYGFSEQGNGELLERLLDHIVKALYPLKYDFPVENPFVAQIKSEYANAYNIAVVLAKELQLSLGVTFPESEIGYLTLHVLGMIESVREPGRRIAVVYGKNPLVGQLLKRRLSLYFPGVRVEHVLASDELDRLPADVDTVVAACELPEADEVNGLDERQCIRVSEWVTNEDMKNVSIQLNRGMLRHYLSPDDFCLLDEHNRDDILKALTSFGDIPHLRASVLERERMSSTNIGHLVAMPHPFDSGDNKKLRVLAAINKRKVAWGDGMAQIVFLFVPPKNQKMNNTTFFEEIYHVFRQTDMTDRLLQVTNYDEFLEAWSSGS